MLVRAQAVTDPGKWLENRRFRGLLLWSDLNHQLNATDFRTCWRHRIQVDLDRIVVNIADLLGFSIVEVVVRMGAGVVEGPFRIDEQFPDQSLAGKQAEGVVDRGLRDRTSCPVGQFKYLISGEVLRARQYGGRDLDPLNRGADAMATQQVYDFPALLAILWIDLVHNRKL